MIKDERCFAEVDSFTCHALTERHCIDCKFYKTKREIVDNPFYEFSYRNKDKIKNIKKRYYIREEQVLKNK